MSTASHTTRTAGGRRSGMPPNACASCSETETLGSVTSSLRLDLAGARHFGPVRDLVGDVGAELRWRHRHDRERLGFECVAKARRRKNLVDLLVELAHDGLGELRRADDPVPGETVEALV